MHLDHLTQLLMPESVIMHIDTQYHRGLLTVTYICISYVDHIIACMSCVS